MEVLEFREPFFGPTRSARGQAARFITGMHTAAARLLDTRRAWPPEATEVSVDAVPDLALGVAASGLRDARPSGPRLTVAKSAKTVRQGRGFFLQRRPGWRRVLCTPSRPVLLGRASLPPPFGDPYMSSLQLKVEEMARHIRDLCDDDEIDIEWHEKRNAWSRGPYMRIIQIRPIRSVVT